MSTVSRCIAFLVACGLVLLSLLTYTEVLSRYSKWFKHSPGGVNWDRRLLNNYRISSLTREDSSSRSILDFVGRTKQLRYKLSNDTSPSYGDAEKVGQGPHPVGLKIMVMAQMRTGSTLLGEIFNQNPNLFYLFEPLHATDSLVQLGIIEPERMPISMATLLRKLATCTFPSEFMLDIFKWRLGRAKSRTIHDMCESKLKCSRTSPSLFSARCAKRKGNMAMKMIRSDLDTVQPLITDDNLNVKILHLVRDPRGTANSRKGYYCQRMKLPSDQCSLDKLQLLNYDPKKRKYNTVDKFCQWMRKTVPTALQRPDWLQGRYKLIRYEDLAADPLRFTKDIYNFLGLPLPLTVTDWVTANTQENNSKSGKAFSTKKNSTEAAVSWRTSLSFKEIQDVERICRDVMVLLGYRPVESEDDMRNFDVPVTLPLNIGPDISFV